MPSPDASATPPHAAPAPIPNDDAHLTVAQRARIKRLTAPREPAPSDHAAELNIVPFLDIITNVLMFVLATLSIVFTTALDVEAPAGSTRPGGVPSEALGLTVIMGTDGYYIKTSAGSIAPNCRAFAGSGTTVGPTVPMRTAGSAPSYDARGFGECLRTMKSLIPGAEHEQQLMVTANPNVPAQEIITLIGAAKRDQAGPLFPKVLLTVQ